MTTNIISSNFAHYENPKILKAEFEEIRNGNGQPVQCVILIANDNGTPVVEIVQPTQEDDLENFVRQDVRIDVRSMEIAELRNQLAAELKEIAYLTAELASAKAHIACITAPPAELDYSDLVNIAMIQSNGEINGWNNVTLSDSNFYATHKARAETNPQYLAILNSCRSNYRADRDADAMRARCERLMDDMTATMTLDEQIALGLLDNDEPVTIKSLDELYAIDNNTDWPPGPKATEDMVHDHFAEQWAEGQD